ncbi:MAG: succinylglutamate desuccinylase/aspartoacylase family protein [Candidatus Limnocylindrales bacterium]
MTRPVRAPFEFAGTFIPAGRTAVVELPIPQLVTGARISLPVRIYHGRYDGPVAWVSAAIHGDEIGGVEIVRRVSAQLQPRQLRGTVLSVPIVNVHGFLNGDRYLPDRRDLNRSFPGSSKGSLAGRVASAFMREIVTRADVGIDLHTGSDHRSNLPQLRGDFDDPRTRELARAFGAPLILHSGLRDGSLRAAAIDAGVTVLLYEGGEAWRFDEDAIAVATSGTLRVLATLGMIPDDETSEPDEPLEARSSRWVRARRSGIALVSVGLGDRVTRGQRLAVIHDSLGRTLSRASAPSDGVVIGLTQHPLVHQGDAIVHIATIESKDTA